jgi:hypothetical protein
MILKSQGSLGEDEEHNFVYHVRVLHPEDRLLTLATNIRLGLLGFAMKLRSFITLNQVANVKKIFSA